MKHFKISFLIIVSGFCFSSCTMPNKKIQKVDNSMSLSASDSQELFLLNEDDIFQRELYDDNVVLIRNVDYGQANIVFSVKKISNEQYSVVSFAFFRNKRNTGDSIAAFLGRRISLKSDYNRNNRFFLFLLKLKKNMSDAPYLFYELDNPTILYFRMNDRVYKKVISRYSKVLDSAINSIYQTNTLIPNIAVPDTFRSM